MLIDLKTKLAGPAGSFPPGRHDMPEALALAVIDAGSGTLAEVKPVSTPDPEPVAELKPAPLTRVRRKSKKKPNEG